VADNALPVDRYFSATMIQRWSIFFNASMSFRSTLSNSWSHSSNAFRFASRAWAFIDDLLLAILSPFSYRDRLGLSG
jgi:hypothetical protein